ncbi:MAG: hypothetical protein J6D34_08075 [Atopobiaceae bacterium]|nr:hypothetical protein [Atopobiaceae bacterium]
MSRRTRLAILVSLVWTALAFFLLGRPALADVTLADGSYLIPVTLEGGSGKASVDSPAPLDVIDGEATLTVTWSSPNYDYMIVDGTTYQPINTGGNSVFEIPVASLDEPLEVVGDTTAMSVPHEIDYRLIFDPAHIKEPDEAGETGPMLPLACVLAAVAAVCCAILIIRKRPTRS